MPPRVAATSSEESDFRQSTPVTSPAKPCPSGLIDTLKTALQLYCGSFQSTTRGNGCRRRIPSAFGDAGERPADPIAQRLAHYEIEIAPLQPRQFLGEQRHALPPGAVHAGDVGAPEHPLGAERVKTAVQMRVQAAERVFVLGIARLAGRLDRYVRVFG